MAKVHVLVLSIFCIALSGALGHMARIYDDLKQECVAHD